MSYNSDFQIEFQPSLQEWKDRIINMIFTIRKVLCTIECLKSKEIGSARESNLMKIFAEDDEMIEKTNSKLEEVLDFLFKIPEILEEKIESFAYLHENTVEIYKKKLKKMHFEDYRQEINRLKQMQKEINDCLFLEKLPTGLFLIDVEGLKVTKNTINNTYIYIYISLHNKENQPKKTQ